MFETLSPAARADAEAVAARLPDDGVLGVAFSGGVDSTVLLAIAIQALGTDRVVALMGTSSVVPARERQLASQLAAELGARLVEFETRELELPAFRANKADRCYVCKNAMFTQISDEMASQYGITQLAYGENADDMVRLDRPGARAAAEQLVLRPLADAGLSKQRIRALAAELQLPVANKPAAPCLASRIPHGVEVTPAKLRQIEAAENGVLGLGFADVRVRHHGDIARIEVPLPDLGRFADDQVRAAVWQAIKAAGYRYVTVDLAGLQSGAFTMQEVHHG